jgi:SnoaL-like domain
MRQVSPDAHSSKLGPGDVFTSMLHAIDILDWDAFHGLFAPRVALDYTSLWGGEPETSSVEDLVAAWQQLAHGFDATQHLTGPVVVTPVADDEHRARGQTTVRAYHQILIETATGSSASGGGVWMVAGEYDVGFVRAADGWRIDAITLRRAYEDGDRGLVDVARRRTATGSGGRTASMPAPKEEPST